MPELAIQANELGKQYRLGAVENAFTRLRRKITGDEGLGHMWALRDVTFDIEEGAAVAIVGRNGAGKSTLLKLLARITEPTSGYADVRGRVGALLEVGTGFHGELSGRDNVFLNGSILGMSRTEVKRKFDEIVEFAGVEKHIDTPVKWYSSGMYVRLGFAVAAHLEPEILIVDEVLAVGDAEFQKRCLGRMDTVAQDGRTVLFVSHNMQAVRRLCKRAILLESGQVVEDGDVEPVVRGYLASVDTPDLGRKRWDEPDDRPGDETCRLVGVSVTDERGQAGTSFFSSSPIYVTLEFDLTTVESAFIAGFDLATVDGVTVFRSYHTDLSEQDRPPLAPGRNAIQCVIPPGLLNSGRYVINLRFSLHWTKWIIHDNGALHFDVVSDHGDSLFLNDTARPGVVAPILDWTVVEPDSETDVAAVGRTVRTAG